MNRKISHWKVTFIVPHTAADAFCDALENAFRPETFAITTSEAEPGSSPLVQTSSEWNEVEARGAWRLEALYLEEPEIDAIRDVLKPVEEETGIAASDLSQQMQSSGSAAFATSIVPSTSLASTSLAT